MQVRIVCERFLLLISFSKMTGFLMDTLRKQELIHNQQLLKCIMNLFGKCDDKSDNVSCRKAFQA